MPTHVASKRYSGQRSKKWSLVGEGAGRQRSRPAYVRTGAGELGREEREELMRLQTEHARLKAEHDKLLKASSRFLADIARLVPLPPCAAGGVAASHRTQKDDLSAWLSGLT